MKIVRKDILLAMGLLALAQGAAWAASDEAPAPRKSPREPVHQQTLDRGKTAALPPSRVVTGNATATDSDRLRIGDIEMRLFGVVPPQLSASYGPQARAVLDGISRNGPMSCTVLDRDRDGRFLATCRGANNEDPAIELLRRGFGVTARGSLRGTEVASVYEAAEEAAQAQKAGLWSVALPSAASETSLASAAKEKEKEVAEVKSEPKPELKAEVPAEPVPQVKPEPPAKNAKGAKAEKSPAPEKIEALPPPRLEEFLPLSAPPPSPPAPFVERYQLLITGLLMLLTLLGLAGTWLAQRRWERREECRALAAALRGELMAARALCRTRLKALIEGTEEKNVPWPRIRTMVFQAYVGRLGYLGADLARQVASIYGQASDYAHFYSAPTAAEAREAISKRQALQALFDHIEEVLPRLAALEGLRLVPVQSPPRRAPEGAAKPQEQSSAPSPQPVAATPPVAEDVAIAPETPVEQPATPQPAPTRSPLWGALRRFTGGARPQDAYAALPDYATLSDEELEALAYSEANYEEVTVIKKRGGK